MNDDIGLTTRCPKCGYKSFDETGRHGTTYIDGDNRIVIMCQGCEYRWSVDVLPEIEGKTIEFPK